MFNVTLETKFPGGGENPKQHQIYQHTIKSRDLVIVIKNELYVLNYYFIIHVFSS